MSNSIPQQQMPVPNPVSRTQVGPWKQKNSRFASMQGVRNEAQDEIYIPNQDQFINEVMNRVM